MKPKDSQRITVDRFQKILSQILAPRIYFIRGLSDFAGNSENTTRMPWWLDLSVGAAAPEWINEYVRIRGRRKVRIAIHPILLLWKYNGRCTSLTRDRWWVSSEQKKKRKKENKQKQANELNMRIPIILFYCFESIKNAAPTWQGAAAGCQASRKIGTEVNGCESPKSSAIIVDNWPVTKGRYVIRWLRGGGGGGGWLGLQRGGHSGAFPLPPSPPSPSFRILPRSR